MAKIVASCILICAAALVGCTKVDATQAKVEADHEQRKPLGKNKTVELDLTDYFAKAQKADAITDGEARCLAYPALPGLDWDKRIVAARCALQRKPMIALEEVQRLVLDAAGRKLLDTKYAALLDAHYSDPSQREQIFVSTEIFEQGRDTAEIVDGWVKSAPDSAYANLAAGLQRVGAAAAARGSDTARETPDQDLKTMDQFAAEGVAYLAKARKLEPRLSPACEAEADLQRMTQGGRVAATTAHACLAKDPASYFLVMAWSRSHDPRWGGEGTNSEVIAHIDRYSKENPLLSSIKTLIQAESYAGVTEEMIPEVLGELRSALDNGPNSLVLNMVSAGYYQSGNEAYGLAYLSQAIRFNIGISRYREVRAQRNLVNRPAWAALDLRVLSQQNPSSSFYRTLLAAAERRAAELGSADGSQTNEMVMDNPGDFRKALILSECEQFILSGKSGTVLDACPDNVVKEWPEDSEAWRVRAETLHYLKRPEALEAARKYLELAQPTSPNHEATSRRFKHWLDKE